MEENPYIGPFAERLVQLRSKKGVSAHRMSKDLGQNSSYIHNIESQKNFPMMLNFFDMCAYLGVEPAEYFLYDKDDPMKDRELLAEIEKLDAQSKEYYLKLIRDTNNRPK